MSVRRKFLIYKICTFVLAIGMIVCIIAISNPKRNEPDPIIAETPVPEARTKIEYRTIEVPYEVKAEPIYIKEYVEVTTHNENRYSGIEITDEDIYLMEQLVYHEARGECFAGQRMVAEVVLNRVLSDEFPNTISKVIYQHHTMPDGSTMYQFSPAPILAGTVPNQTQHEAVMAAIYETPITDEDVLYFSVGAYNNKVFCRIGGHVFCRT